MFGGQSGARDRPGHQVVVLYRLIARHCIMSVGGAYESNTDAASAG